MSSIQSFAVAGIKPYVLGYLMCKNTPIIQKIMELINKELTSLVKVEPFIEANKAGVFLSDVKDFTGYYKEVFLQLQSTVK